MTNLYCALLLAMVSSSAVHAQEVELHTPRADDNLFVPERDSATNHGSGYLRYETARQLAHRNAALRAAQRRERMAMNARFGYSPSRPPASTVPFMGSPIAPPAEYRVYTPYPGFVFPRPYSRF
ncbi:MAG TPA: hypothetical protein VMM76_06330 [Pirellulaceae bacterium]|nr:hypothetical protein [Pirellulaceae bacterium]